MIVTFDCELELHNREKFQAMGHFVPGNCTGPDVVALTLNQNGVQVARVLAPDIDQAEEFMVGRIRDLVSAAARTSAINQFTYEQFRDLVEDRARLGMFMVQNYAPGAITDGDVIGSAIRYLRIERARWRVRFGDWVRKVTGTLARAPLPSDSNEWLPKKWRQD